MTDERIHGGPDWSRAGFGQVKDPPPDPRDVALDEIGRLAVACFMDMQGRLTDDEHRRAHGVLSRIAALAATALGKS